MKFSYKFLVSTFLILFIVISANIFALKFYAGKYFVEYVDAIKKETNKVEISFIDTILQNKNIDPEIIEEYKSISEDLDGLISSLEKFSKNPKPSNVSLLESLQKSGVSSSTIENIIGANALQSFFSNISNFISLDTTKPEGIFVFKTLKSMSYFNLLLITVILILYYFWINYSFKPISSIIDNLSNIIYKKEYKSLIYNKKDEFFPLIETINSLNKSLSLQEKIRSDFLSDLSHEIKTPITAVKCYLEGIEDGIIIPDDKNMSLLYNEIERLIKITNSIMEFEKEESQKMTDIFASRFDFSSLVEFISGEYLPILSKNHQQIVSYSSSGYFINADSDKISQLLHNIFSNYIKYAGKNSTLVIKTINKDRKHIISFADNGKGVDAQELPFLKEKFYKAEKSRNKSVGSGIGIGLSVIEKIVKLHNGEFYINSQAKKGFEIIIELPR
ncbi:MAG: HAMP domain-containing sensor histidine kinase [Candidatus Gracilibacteria bacterium]|nr:HAMP domain-containing sensor histidine kinase [Candidatus Gracilibacteria bacterium]